jgi:hypothetical protein
MLLFCGVIRNHLLNLRYHIARFLTIIVAIQVINVSVYPDLLQWERADHPVTLNNEMDSIVEYVTEIILGHKDAFPEYAHKHHKDLQQHKHAISLYSEEIADNNEPAPFGNDSMKRCSGDQYAYQFYIEINPPPPKA